VLPGIAADRNVFAGKEYARLGPLMSFTVTFCIGWCQPGGLQWTDTVAYGFRISLNPRQHTNGEVAPPIRRGPKHSGEEWDDCLRELFAFQPASPGGRDVLLKSERRIMSIRSSKKVSKLGT
jgi:hypothetical protein